jgi:hypothetical protein
MRHWTFWEWVAYLCLAVGAMIVAADTGLRVAPELAHEVALIASPFWGFAPLALVIVATLILLAREFGVLAPFTLRRPFRIFLERDSGGTDLYGVQTFPAINYIQISVKSRFRMERCRLWVTAVHYRENAYIPFALEQNERMPCGWSRHHGNPAGTDLEIEINRRDPPIRGNVAIYAQSQIELPPPTPSNLLPLLQRREVHRFELLLLGFHRNRQIAQTCYLFVDWRETHAVVTLSNKASG